MERDELITDKVTLKAIDQAKDMIEDQLLNSDVYGPRTIETMKRASALAGFLKVKAMDEKVAGNKLGHEYLNGVVSALDRIIAALKYKIKSSVD